VQNALNTGTCRRRETPIVTYSPSRILAAVCRS